MLGIPPYGTEIFWGEMSPCEHSVQIYENDERFLETLEEFVVSGLIAGECAIVVATAPHRKALAARLTSRGIDMEEVRRRDAYIVLDAQDTLSEFVNNGWPDEDKFRELATGLLKRARANGRRVRAFGEMVAVLWANGHSAATVRLEHLWDDLCKEEDFIIFCAYPRIGFTDFALKSLEDICAAHSRVLN